jgi:hypothetical protein
VAVDASMPDDVWHTFLAKHHLTLEDQEAFLDYLTEQPDLPIATVRDLEQVYWVYLRRGPPPVDLH